MLMSFQTISSINYDITHNDRPSIYILENDDFIPEPTARSAVLGVSPGRGY
jgi:hypothetical protein